MKVLKFGGTSVGSAQRMKNVAKLICNGEKKIVVLSAMSGTTNSLLEIADYFYKSNLDGALEHIITLENKYRDVVEELLTTEEKRQEARSILFTFRLSASFAKLGFYFRPLLHGRTTFTSLFNFISGKLVKIPYYCRRLNLCIDKNAEPDNAYIKQHLNDLLEAHPGHEIYLTQGFICRNAYGEIDNLQRGGSDYTASLIGAAVNAEEIQIWTDIDGMHNNDPRFVEGTKPIPMLHFEEAAELAYFGAKILHPTCILPAKLANIPVRLLNTMEPEASGTLISTRMNKGKIEAVAAKDGITAIKIQSGRMLLAYGFLRKVFEIFESYKTPIDMITTSEVGVSVTIDNTKKLDEIVNDLKKLGTVTVDHDMVIICVVGDLPFENVGFQSKVVGALKDIPLRMISYGGSNYNISFLIKAEDKKHALNALSQALFSEE